MKKNEFWGLLINPYTRFAGWQAFALGIVFILLTGIVGTFANVYFDGAIDIHFTEKANFKSSFNFLGIDLLSVFFALSIAGIFVSKNFRLIDILGTITLAKAPFLLFAIASLLTKSPGAEQIIKNPLLIFSSASFVIVMLLSIPIIIWYIILLYNAFKTSTGAKGNQVVIAFIIALLIAEIISKLLIIYIM